MSREKDSYKRKMDVIEHPDGSLTFKINGPDGPASVTFMTDGTTITQMPTDKGVQIVVEPGRKRR